MDLTSASKLLKGSLGNATNLASAVVQYFDTDIPPVLRNPHGIRKQKNLGQTILHAACRYNLSVAEFSLIMTKVPNAVRQSDYDSSLPLHIACYNNRPMDVILELFTAFPDAIFAKDKSGATPIHYFCSRHSFVIPSISREEYIFVQNAQAARVKDLYGLLPLHVACSNNKPIEVIRSLVDVYPEAVMTQDDSGDTPLHSICRQSSFNHDTARLLIDMGDSVVFIKDSKGRTPLDILTGNISYYMNQYLAGYDALTDEQWSNFDKLLCLLAGVTNNQNKLPPYPSSEKQCVLHTLLSIDSIPYKCIEWALKKYPHQTREQDKEGNLPLHKLALSRCNVPESIITSMINLHTDALHEKNNEGYYPLFLATKCCSETCMPRLIFCAYPVAIYQFWNTPLYPAILSYVGNTMDFKGGSITEFGAMYRLVRETMDLMPPLD
uniref:Ankyrin repeat protein n=1 Tax=Ditylum brightwellii TaxID=49249 RepID=A0A7S2A3H2_9STRA|mmetsp:Transcript_7920/g.11809  ORF Transcript_7920/g.11809 Transcript_7920/m.11809 type:complete len:437 (+) Transcript_7920:104-1414(+)